LRRPKLSTRKFSPWKKKKCRFKIAGIAIAFGEMFPSA